LPAALISRTADLALKGDDAAIADGLQELLAMGHDFLALHGALVGPAARLLGDWWLEDRIGAVEVTIALSYLQRAVRRVGSSQSDRMDEQNAARHILISPQPGEPHRLGAALLGDAFHRLGWQVTSEFPTSVEALKAFVMTNHFDALTLCLSDVFDRVDQILPLAHAIRSARAASCNPALVILAGGRLFQTQPDLAEFIGANAVYVSAEQAIRAAQGHLAQSDRAERLGVAQTPPAFH
jgi:methanogenic corrinoid protein MtbC1